ncbi:four helix bundle protein [Nodosilinea sp. E11]|uniref:four helix bundle protein n=1 Tax=Nodosilinea sp. E11 TaxID=3037479 RepID=UPI00293530D1|nr:four helix bundle protein [Nodosilinea sp. E11]WOD37187.1 four helix bundle protein [Nodosilinea sp. E11]
MQRPTHHLQTLQVYQMAFQGSVAVARWAQPLLEASEVYLIQQFLATSQAVRAHLAAALGQRRHHEGFIAALSTAQLQSAEMQTWIEAAIAAGYLAPDAGQDLYDHYRSLYTALDHLMATASTATISLEKNAETALPAIA